MKGIDKTKHTHLLGALHELLGLIRAAAAHGNGSALCPADDGIAVGVTPSDRASGELLRIEADIAALSSAHDNYLSLLEQLRVAVSDYDTLHADLRRRTCHALRHLRRTQCAETRISALKTVAALPVASLPQPVAVPRPAVAVTAPVSVSKSAACRVATAPVVVIAVPRPGTALTRPAPTPIPALALREERS